MTDIKEVLSQLTDAITHSDNAIVRHMLFDTITQLSELSELGAKRDCQNELIIDLEDRITNIRNILGTLFMTKRTKIKKIKQLLEC